MDDPSWHVFVITPPPWQIENDYFYNSHTILDRGRDDDSSVLKKNTPKMSIISRFVSTGLFQRFVCQFTSARPQRMFLTLSPLASTNVHTNLTFIPSSKRYNGCAKWYNHNQSDQMSALQLLLEVEWFLTRRDVNGLKVLGILSLIYNLHHLIRHEMTTDAKSERM